MIYFISYHNYVKIGFTNKVKSRISQIQTSLPEKIEMELLIEGGFGLEAELHLKFRTDRTNGEWFLFSDDIKEFIEKHKGKDLSWKYGFSKEVITNNSIKDLRNRNGLSMEAMGNLLGVTKQAVARVEWNEQRGAVTLAVLKKYGDAVGERFEYRFIKK